LATLCRFFHNTADSSGGELQCLAPASCHRYLHADQVDYFKFTPLYEGFKMLHDMASDTINYASEFWLNLAMEAVVEENVRKAAQRTKWGTESGGYVCADDEASDEDQGE
jgi:hypothetical protein